MPRETLLPVVFDKLNNSAEFRLNRMALLTAFVKDEVRLSL
jgi:hypothetical protein